MSLRPLLPLLLACLLVGALPVGGQAVATATLLEDDDGDVTLMLAGTPGPDATAAYPAADLVSLTLTEGAQDFTWVLQVGDLKPSNEDTGADGVEYEVRFEHHGRYFLLRIYRTLPVIGGGPVAYLDARDATDGYWGRLWYSFEGVKMDFAADTFTVTLPRLLLADADGAAPFPGRNLTAISVHSSSALGQGTINIGGPVAAVPYTVVDDMPDLGQPPASYAVLVGVQQTGHARLGSPMPFRASNGEATTFVYQVEASNAGDENETFELTVRDVPGRLSVVLPVPLLPIPANTTVTIPVLATVPFAHVHGELDRFLLELTSLDDPGSVGRIELGVNYLAVPHPAGHHDVLFLHNPASPPDVPGLQRGLLPFDAGTMSTIEDTDTLPPYHATGLSTGSSGMSFSWDYELAPALQMGLDVDLDRLGLLNVAIGTTLPILQATLEGDLYVRGPESYLVAALAPQAPVDIGANSEIAFEVDLVPQEDGDLVPLQPGSNLILRLELTGMTASTFSGEANPYVAAGGSMRLPLNEWHDDVDDALASMDGPSLEALGPQERLVNPGEAVVFSVALDNPTNESMTFRLAVTGQNAAWAALADNALHVPAESTANVTLIVRAPAEALDGERADLILQAYPRDEPSLRGLIRLVAEVDTDEDHLDDAPLADEISKGKDAPAPPLALVALALLAVAWGRRRA